jgi:hypothetical protein
MKAGGWKLNVRREPEDFGDDERYGQYRHVLYFTACSSGWGWGRRRREDSTEVIKGRGRVYSPGQQGVNMGRDSHPTPFLIVMTFPLLRSHT